MKEKRIIKKTLKTLIMFILLLNTMSYAQICNSSGNLIIYSNYNGGNIGINVDVNIPNLYIGICSYENVLVTISGTFSNNVVGVTRVGYNAMNNHCGLGTSASTVIGLPITVNTYGFGSVNTTGNITYSPNHGNGFAPSIVGAGGDCDTLIYQGGGNTPDEVVYYFLQQYPSSTLRYHHTQYNCWNNIFNVSAGGNCCILPAAPCSAPSSPTNVTPSANLTICAGSSTTLSASSTATVNWYASSSSTVVLATGANFNTPVLAVGNYTYYAGAINGCGNSATKTPITINVNTAPTITTTAATSATICSGQSYTISNLSGGTGNYTLTNTGSTNATQFVVSPTANTIYTVVGANSSGCISLASSDLNVNITVNATPTITTSGASSGTLCSGQSFTISPLSGSGTGSYTLTPGNLTSTTNFVVTPSVTTTYSIVGANANGCISTSSSDLNVGLTVNSTPTVNAVFSSNALCSSQSITITMTGANSGYTLNPGNTPISSGTSSIVLTPPSGTTVYTITANNSNGCVTTLSQQIYTTSVSVVTNPTITASAITNSICAGGTASITPFGATTFTLMPGNIQMTSGGTYTLTPIVATTYTINGTATGGCQSIASTQFVTTIGINANPTITAVSALSNTICTGLTTTLTASGATSYTWSGGPSTADYIVSPSATTIYTVIGENASGCSNSTAPLTLTVNVLSSPTLALATSINTNTLCSGNSATITLGGASAGSTYSLFPGTSTSTSSFVVNPTSTTDYTVIATDNVNGCVSTTSAQLFTTTVTVSTSPTIALSSIAPSATLCSGQSVTITPTGGVAGSYTLVNTNASPEPFVVTPLVTTTYTISGAGSSGCISTASSDLVTTITVNQTPTITASSQQDALCFGGATGSVTLTTMGGTGALAIVPTTTNNLIAGPYTYTVTDVLGCFSTAMITINQPTASVTVASAVETASNSNCITFNGSGSVMPAGGTPTYNVVWDGGFPIGTTVTGLNTGVHTFTITDANGCTNSAITGSINITGVTGITTMASIQTSVSCLAGTNGALTFTTTSSGPDSYTLTNVGLSTVVGTNTTGVFTGLVAGTYSVYVLGISGCVATQVVTINQPTVGVNFSSSSVTVGSVSCFGGMAVVTATATGGSGVYTYNWSSNVSTINTASYTAGGPYTVSVVDGNNCPSVTSQTFIIAQPTSSVSMTTLLNTGGVPCNGGVTSVIALTSGGTGPISYLWQANTSTVNTATYGVGTYTMLAMDVNGCSSTVRTFTVTEPSVITINEVKLAPSCATQNTGVVEIMPVGGTPNYSVLWSNGSTTFTLTNLASGAITATVTDTNGCLATYNTVVEKENCITIVFSEIITPNGDGINEPFIINGLEQYPNNKLEIYNRWGSLIFTKAPYDNSFDGKANVSGTMGTGLLPGGTYFIVFDFGDGETPAHKGYLELKY